MIRALIILTLLFSSCSGQNNITVSSTKKYAYQFKTNNEFGVINYKLQRSRNNRNWITLTTITPQFKPDSNSYTIQLASSSIYYYFRVTAYMRDNKMFYTQPIYTKTR